jgi:ribonuclease T2
MLHQIITDLASAGTGFTLTSSKGKCAISNGAFTCASSVSTGTIFTAIGGKLAASGSTVFYASAVAAGSTQQTVYTTSHTVTLDGITWQQV